MDDIQDQELLAEFVSESLSGLQDIEQDLLALETADAGDGELVNRIFRAVHSIKGTGSYMGLDNLVQVAHLGETLLDEVRSGTRSVDSDVVDAVLGAVDALVAMLQAEDLGGSFETESVLKRLEVALGAENNSSGSESGTSVSKSDRPAAVPTGSNNESGNTTRSLPADVQELVDPELLGEFVSEAVQGLRDVEQDLLALEGSNQCDNDLVNRVFRAVHTIKGNAGYMGLDNLVSVAHKAETLLDGVRDGSREPSAEVMDAVLGAIDSLNEMLAEADLGASYDPSPIVAKLNQVLGTNDESASPNVNWGADSDWEQAKNALRKGYPGFALFVELSQLHELIDTKEGLLDGLNSLGRVLHATLPVEQLNNTPKGRCVIFYETVLEAELVQSHFGLPAEYVVPIREGKPSAASASLTSPAKQTTFPSTEREVAQSASNAKSAESAKDHSLPQPVARSSSPKSGNSTKPAAGASAANEQTMRVPVRILHELLEWTGNMVMARNQLMNEFEFGGSQAFQTLSQAISGVHETVIQTRMQTTGTLFERYRRVVRDLGRKLGKEVAFHIEGGDLELDRTILESFADPLTHLIRNCMDHALETPQERERAGKIGKETSIFVRTFKVAKSFLKFKMMVAASMRRRLLKRRSKRESCLGKRPTHSVSRTRCFWSLLPDSPPRTRPLMSLAEAWGWTLSASTLRVWAGSSRFARR